MEPPNSVDLGCILGGKRKPALGTNPATKETNSRASLRVSRSTLRGHGLGGKLFEEWYLTLGHPSCVS